MWDVLSLGSPQQNASIYIYIYITNCQRPEEILNPMWNGQSTDLIQKSLRCELDPKDIRNPHARQH